MPEYVVILFYKFFDITDPKSVADLHRTKCTELGFLGRMLVAEEGINATFEGTRENVELYKAFLKTDPRWSDIVIKESKGNGKSFRKLSIKVRDEVVTLRAGRFDVAKETAPEISVSELHDLYKKNEDFVVLDLRNDYEIASGKFEKTIDPKLHTFRELPEKIAAFSDLKDKKVVTVCTGGIRCEKATCYLKRQGFSNLYQLKDGIHTYMQAYPNEHFKGTLFVFDNRLTTDVVELPKKEIVGKCVYCEIPTENYCADLTSRPSKKVICCLSCAETEGAHLRQLSVLS